MYINFNHLVKKRFICSMTIALVCGVLLGAQFAELKSTHEDCEDKICLCTSSPSDSDLDLINDGYSFAAVLSAVNVHKYPLASVTSRLVERFKSIRAPPYNQ